MGVGVEVAGSQFHSLPDHDGKGGVAEAYGMGCLERLADEVAVVDASDVLLLLQSPFALHARHKAYLAPPYGPSHLQLAADAAYEGIVGQGVDDARSAENADAAKYADTRVEGARGYFLAVLNAYRNIHVGMGETGNLVADHLARSGVDGWLTDRNAKTWQSDGADAFALEKPDLLFEPLTLAAGRRTAADAGCNAAAPSNVGVVAIVLGDGSNAFGVVLHGDGENLPVGKRETCLLRIIIVEQRLHGGLGGCRGTGSGGQSRLQREERWQHLFDAPSEAVSSGDVGPLLWQTGTFYDVDLQSQSAGGRDLSLKAPGGAALLGKDGVAPHLPHKLQLVVGRGEAETVVVENNLTVGEACFVGLVGAFLTVQDTEEGLVCRPVAPELADGVYTAECQQAAYIVGFHLACGIIIVVAVGNAAGMLGEGALQSDDRHSCFTDGFMEIFCKGMGCIYDTADGVAHAECLDVVGGQYAGETHSIVHLHILQVAFRGVEERLASLVADLHGNASLRSAAKYQYHCLPFLKR